MLRISLTKTACLLPLLALCLSGCGLTQRVSEGTKSAFNAVFYKKINTLHLDFTAREALNTDARENHSLSEPVVVRIYQLKDRQTFDRLVYQQLLEEGGAEMRARWARTSALIQTAYVIQAIRAVGLAAGPMNGDDAEALATEFFAGQDVEVLLVINVGHPGPDAYQERNPRLPFEEVYRVL